MGKNKDRFMGEIQTKNNITIDFVYDESNILIEKVFTGKEGKLKIDDYILARGRQENDENGNIIKGYFEAEYNPCLSTGDYLQIIEKYTGGNITHIVYIKAEGDTCFRPDTYGFYQYRYDEQGHAIE
jgi:hypothetical protein